MEASCTARAMTTAQASPTTAQTEAATAPQVRLSFASSRVLDINEANSPSVLTLMFAFYFSGSQNQKKGMQAQKMLKHNAVTWGEAMSAPHANALDCDDYSLPMEGR